MFNVYGFRYDPASGGWDTFGNANIKGINDRENVSGGSKHPLKNESSIWTATCQWFKDGVPVPIVPIHNCRFAFLVYRTTTTDWKGPINFMSVDNEKAVIHTRLGRRIFRTTCVNPYLKSLFREANATSVPHDDHMTDIKHCDAQEGNPLRKVVTVRRRRYLW